MSCSTLIEMELEDKVKTIKVDHEKGTAIIDYDENSIKIEEINKIIKDNGFEVVP